MHAKKEDQASLDLFLKKPRTTQNPASYGKLYIMFLFYISLLLNTDFSNKFYVFFWCTTFIYLFTCLFIGFYKTSDSTLWDHCIWLTRLQLILPTMDALGHKLFHEMSEYTFFPIHSIKSVVVVIFLKKFACIFFKNKQHSKTGCLCLMHVALSGHFKLCFSSSCYGLRSNYCLTSLGVTGET